MEIGFVFLLLSSIILICFEQHYHQTNKKHQKHHTKRIDSSSRMVEKGDKRTSINNKNSNSSTSTTTGNGSSSTTISSSMATTSNIPNQTETNIIKSSTSYNTMNTSSSSMQSVRSIDNNNMVDEHLSSIRSSSTSSLQSLYNHLTKPCRIGGRCYNGFDSSKSTEENYCTTTSTVEKDSSSSSSCSEQLFVGPFAHIRQNKIDYTYHKHYTTHRQRLQNSIVWELLDPQRIQRTSTSKNGEDEEEQESSSEDEGKQQQEQRQEHDSPDISGNTITLSNNTAMICTTPTQPWVLFVAGSQGVGKRQVIQHLIQQGNLPLLSFCFIDADEIARCYLPEYEIYVNDYENNEQQQPQEVDEEEEEEKDSSSTTTTTKTKKYCNGHHKALDMCRKESGFISELLLWVALEAGKNVVVSGQCKNIQWYKSLFQRIKHTYNNKKNNNNSNAKEQDNDKDEPNADIEHNADADGTGATTTTLSSSGTTATSKFDCVHIGLLHITASPEQVIKRVKHRVEAEGDASLLCPGRTKQTMDAVATSVKELQNYTNFYCCLQNNIICSTTSNNNNANNSSSCTTDNNNNNDDDYDVVQIMTPDDITWDTFRQTFIQICLWKPKDSDSRRKSSMIRSTKALNKAIHTSEILFSPKRSESFKQRQTNSIRETFEKHNGSLRGVIDEHYPSSKKQQEDLVDTTTTNSNNNVSTTVEEETMGQMLRAIQDHSSINKRPFSIFKSTEENYKVDDVKEGETMEFYGLYAHLRAKLDYTYHCNYSRDRQYLQDTILEDMLRTVKLTDINGDTCTTPTEPWAVFTAGAMGSGKSYTIRHIQQKHNRFPLLAFVKVDPDEIRRLLPEYMLYSTLFPNKAGELTNKECGYMSEILTLAALEGGKNVLVDGSLRDHEWYQSYFQKLRLDYPNIKIAILHITAPREAVLRRAATRAQSTGRVVPKETLERALNEVPFSVNILKDHVNYFCELLNAPDADDIQIVTPNETWETFTSQWHQVCAWVPGGRGSNNNNKKKKNKHYTKNQNYSISSTRSSESSSSKSFVSTTAGPNNNEASNTSSSTKDNDAVLPPPPPNFISLWTQRPPLETFDDHIKSWSRQPSFTLKRQTSSNLSTSAPLLKLDVLDNTAKTDDN